MNIVFIAPPAAGKGTQAGMLKDEYNLYHLSTGDLLREIASTDSLLGKEVKELIDNGKFVSDELMVKLLSQKIESLENNNGIIFDGFPRTIEQANMLNELLEERGEKINHVIFLDIEKEVAQKRATGRVTCLNCGEIYNIYFDTFNNENRCNKCNDELTHRQDDTIEKFNDRFDTYLKKTEPLIEYYKNLGILDIVKTASTKEDTYNLIKSIIEKKA